MLLTQRQSELSTSCIKGLEIQLSLK
jgi:hypothetical protein